MILAMENAGQLIEDEELRSQIKGSGIGTSATRAEILKKLVTIDYLAPGKYGFKLICDDNQNGRWDTGNFKEHRQPERVFYFNQTVETKSGWDIEYTWRVE